jgi:hypothetical protein
MMRCSSLSYACYEHPPSWTSSTPNWAPCDNAGAGTMSQWIADGVVFRSSVAQRCAEGTYIKTACMHRMCLDTGPVVKGCNNDVKMSTQIIIVTFCTFRFRYYCTLRPKQNQN